MEFLGDFSFLSKYRIHLVIDNNSVTIRLEGENNEDFDELKKHFDELKIMSQYRNFGINFAEATLTNINLTKDIYTKNFRGSLHLKTN